MEISFQIKKEKDAFAIEQKELGALSYSSTIYEAFLNVFYILGSHLAHKFREEAESQEDANQEEANFPNIYDEDNEFFVGFGND